MMPAPDLSGDFSGYVELKVNPPTPEGRSEFLLTAGQIDEDAEAYFGRGFCHWLAGAIHCLTGWELVTYDRQEPDGSWLPAHTAVATPEGTVLDIFGEHDSSAVADRYTGGGRFRVRTRQVRNENMPGDVITGTDHLRGDRFWWSRRAFEGPQLTGLVLHFARTLVRRHGYGSHLPSNAPAIPDQRTHNIPTPAPMTTTGGTVLSSIDEIRAILAASNTKAEGILGALAQASQDTQEIQGQLNQATQGSSQASVQEAMGLYAQIAATFDQLMGMVHAARGAVDTYAAGL